MPNWLMSFAAVLSPTPGTPGMLSLVSPFSATKSRYWTGRDAEPLGHRGFVVADDVADAFAVEHHRDQRAHQLEEVAVGGDDRGVDPLFGRPHGQGADRVVGLVAVGDPQHGDRSASSTSSINPSCGRKSPGVSARPGLVVGVLRQAYRGRARVEEDRDQVGSLLGQQLDQHAGEPVDGVRDRSAGGGEGRREREERPVRQRVPVEQEQAAGLGLGIGGGRGHHPYRSVRP